MIDLFLIFPIHLYKNIETLYGKNIYIIEETRFMTEFKYHKLKLAYHRASMKNYYDYLKLEKKIKDVKYINFNENLIKLYKDFNNIKKYNINMYDPCDNILKNKIIKYIPNINILQTPNFLVSIDLINENLNIFSKEKGKNEKYNFMNFYKWQRIRLNILMNSDGKTPVGGLWSFDKDNRERMPESVVVPKIINLNKDNEQRMAYINEAKEYVTHYFPKNYGSLDNFVYPINHEESILWLNNFIKNKFEKFGIYEDAESMKDPFLFHSVLTPMMNIGLLTDNEVLKIVLKYQDKIKLSSFEGFIRQIIGWRNYVYTIYLLEADQLYNANFFKHTNKFNESILWEGKTDIIPFDNIIHKIVDYGYAHHIERLMYLGNYLLLCMIDPKEVYNIFMSWTIDAYDWVMLPNVIGMSQFADGGMMMTRPYFSSSNYILKMSDYKKGVWSKTLDTLYYNFINTHKSYLSKNYATSRQVAHWNKKNSSEQNEIIKNAKKYLEGKMKI